MTRALPGQTADCVAIAAEHWTGGVPDWIQRLAEECNASTQTNVARKIGYSVSVISGVLRRSYKGNLANIERSVREKYLPDRVSCPATGVEILKAQCRRYSERAAAGLLSNPLDHRLKKNCPLCINSGHRSN